MSGVHQFVPMLHVGDAVGRHARSLRAALHDCGVESRLYVEMIDPETADETSLFTQYESEAQPGDVLVYQFATASRVAPWLRSRSERLVVNYHNVTPPECYAPWDNALARHQLAARQQLLTLVERTALAVAVSDYNAAELRTAGFRNVVVVPPAAMVPTVDRPVAARAPRAQGGRWLCIGRLAPNKALERTVMALAVARAHHDRAATVSFVGRPVVPSYTKALHRFVDNMGLADAVTFAGQLGDAELRAAMEAADVLVLPSVHEGFGVPVVEAMALGLPVVANRAGALPDIVGAGGLLVDAADPWALSGAVAQVQGDSGLCAALAAGAQTQLAALDLGTAAPRLAALLTTVS
jgi:glycosyltransferase involved in cell wall biosynthesis